jgi:hypothetical protein
VQVAGRAEQRGHDPADGRGAAVHVAVELGLAADAHRLVAVDAHRGHVAVEQVQRQAVTPAGVDERGDDRVLGAPAGQAGLELGLPGVQGGAPRGAGRQPATVDDLVRPAHEAVQGVDRRLHVARQAVGGAVERRVVPALKAPTRAVGLLQPEIGDDMHDE